MLNQWQPLFTCYLSLTFIRFYVFTKVLNYQQWILGKCLSFIHINLWTNIAGNSNTFENKIKRQHSFITNLYKNQTYTYPKEYIPIFFLRMRKLPTTAQKDLINEPTKIITEIITSHKSHAYSYTFTYITNMWWRGVIDRSLCVITQLWTYRAYCATSLTIT